MQEKIHRQNSHERSEKCGREREQKPGEQSHDSTEQGKSDNPSLHQLLYIPALRDIIIFRVF